MMEYLEGVKKAKTLEIGELLAQAEGTEVKVNGAVHTIRDMGNVAFVILRKRDGLVQCVFEEGVTAFDLKELKEASAVEVLGTIRKEERAAHGIEIRLKEIKVLSEPDEPLPLPISKWKLNTSLEAKLNMRPISLRNVRERAKFKIQEGLVAVSAISSMSRDLRRSTHRSLGPKVQRAVQTSSNWSISTDRRSCSRARSFINR